MERIGITNEITTKKFSNGTELRARRLDVRPRTIPGSTARHEAAHIVAAGTIISATIIPSGDTLGSTTPISMTPEAAAAAGAMGHDGCGWDRFLTEHYLGVPWEAAKASAAAALAGKQEEMEEVAKILEERKTIGQLDVNEATKNVENQRAGIFPVEVVIVTTDGKTTITKSTTNASEIKIEESQLVLITANSQEKCTAQP